MRPPSSIRVAVRPALTVATIITAVAFVEARNLYLLSGDATMVVRTRTGLDAASWRLIKAHGVLASSGNIGIYRTRQVSNLTSVTDLAALTHW